MKTYVLVGIGGMIGASLRYLLGVFVNIWWLGMFPISTLIANLFGAFFLTWFTESMMQNKFLSKELSIAFTTGLIGSFTTFSTLSVETIMLVENNAWFIACLYVMVSIIGGFIMAFSGYKLGNKRRLAA